MGILDKHIERLKDNNYHVQVEAAEEIGMIGGERAIEALIQTFNDENSFIRDKAIKAIGMIGGERAIKTLIQALKDEYTVVRVEAAEALGDIGDEKAIEPLTQALKDENQYVREAAALALGKIKDGRKKEPPIKGGSGMEYLLYGLVLVIEATLFYFLAFLVLRQLDTAIPPIGSQTFIIFVVIWPFIAPLVRPGLQRIPIIGEIFSLLDSTAMSALRTKEKPEEKIDACNKDIEINPQDGKAWNNKGAALFHLKRYEEAITCYDRALEIDPQCAIARDNKEHALSELEKMKKQ